MADLTVVQGDSKPDVTATLTYTATGDPVDLSGASVNFQMRKDDDRRYTVNAAATITDAPNGKVRYSWGANDLANAGDYQVQWQITFADTSEQTTDPVGIISVRRQ